MNTDNLRAYSVKAAAELMGCSSRHLYKLIKAKEIAAFPIGKRGFRIRALEIDRWLSEKERNHTGTVTAPSAGAAASGLSTSALKALSGSGLN
jgi:excisionase family DNA binding protein